MKTNKILAAQSMLCADYARHLDKAIHDRPLAAKGVGLTSYRYPSAYGGRWIMIGASDNADAISEANRSLSIPNATLDKLQVWDGERYVLVVDKDRDGAMGMCSENGI